MMTWWCSCFENCFCAVLEKTRSGLHGREDELRLQQPGCCPTTAAELKQMCQPWTATSTTMVLQRLGRFIARATAERVTFSSALHLHVGSAAFLSGRAVVGCCQAPYFTACSAEPLSSWRGRRAPAQTRAGAAAGTWGGDTVHAWTRRRAWRQTLVAWQHTWPPWRALSVCVCVVARQAAAELSACVCVTERP